MDKEWNSIKKLIDETIDNEYDNIQLGNYSKYHIFKDMKHFIFSMGRYKFVSKLLMYEDECRVLELGCNEALGALMLAQNTNLKKYTGIDFDANAISWNKNNLLNEDFEFIVSDFFELKDKLSTDNKYNLIFSLDVIEHLKPDRENDFLSIFCDYLAAGGVAIIGTPNITMTPYASEGSVMGHINLYDQKRLHALCKKYFENVMIFGMNDEIVHTGFAPMSCYIFAVCTGKK